jgi:uncharacterized membrane protein
VIDNEDTNQTPAESLDANLARTTDEEKMAIRYLKAMSSFSGPLPPPEILKAYDLVKPGLAGEIFEMAKTITAPYGNGKDCDWWR